MKKFLGFVLALFGGALLLTVILTPNAQDRQSAVAPAVVVAALFFLGSWRLLRKKSPKTNEGKSTATPTKAMAVHAPSLDIDKLFDEAQKRAAKIVQDAEKRAASIIADANRKGNGTRQGSPTALHGSPEEVLLIARQEAASIIAAAHARAEEIAGDTLGKVQEALDYEKAIKAMRNVLEGYGSEYLVPTQSFLDDLADAFGFTEAGQALKDARLYSRQMVKSGQAATCDYVEDYRKNTAIAFVVDAFNGKVDTILSRTKNDNIGKLQQEIKDAFALVNINGKAFRDARIVPEYLAARLEEARWGCVAVELREQAKEEQRAIKERMREEERARRDFEKALREAAKEEENLQKALKAAQEEIALQVSEAQRAKLEEKIAALHGKLADAEERASRAKSMAEMTSSGHVYIISNIGSFGENVLKIGMTRRLEPLDRVKELGDASVPFTFDVHAMIYSVNASKLESDLHRIFNPQRLNKVNYRKEFFGVTLEQVREAVEALGHKVQFTMLAEAREYTETKSIEKLSDGEKSTLLAHMLEQEAADTSLEEEYEEQTA